MKMTCEAFWDMHVYGYITIWYMTLCNMVHAVFAHDTFVHVFTRRWGWYDRNCSCNSIAETSKYFYCNCGCRLKFKPSLCLLYIITFYFLYPFSFLQHKCVFGSYHVFDEHKTTMNIIVVYLVMCLVRTW